MKCERCDKDAYLGFQCKRCGGYFCSAHRLPEAHECAFRNMSKEELGFRVQYEKTKARNETFDATPEPPLYTERERPRERVERVNFDDDEDYDGRYVTRTPVVDFSLSLLIFVIFAITDAIYMSFNPFMFLALIVHAAFLPVLFYMVYKQKRGAPPRMILTFLQVVITYMIVYIGVKVVVNILVFDPISIAINLLIGIFMIYMFNKVLQQLRYAF